MVPDARSLRTLLRSESSVSEVLATVLLTATTVVLLGGFALVLLGSVDDTRDPAAGSFSFQAEEGADHVELRFVSGTAFPLADAQVVLLVNGSDATGGYHLDGPAVPFTFSPGDTLRVNLTAGTLPTDARLMLLVVDRATGQPIGTTVATLLSDSTLPPFVTGTPSIPTVSFSPATLVVDGSSLANLSVHVASPFGLDLVRSVTVNLTTVGGAAETFLLDDGQGADALAGDGIYTAQVAAATHDFEVTPSTETVQLPLLLRDVFGKTATASVTLTLETAPLGKVSTGAKWRGLPASDAVDYVNLTDLTYRDEAALDNDQVQLRVSDLDGTGDAWTALVTFGSPATCGGEPGVVAIQLSRDGVPGSATYAPSPGPCFSLGDLSKINVANPPLSLDAAGAAGSWSVTGSATAFLYASAGISATNEATITFLGDSVTPAPSALGLGQADVEWARLSSNFRPTAGFGASTSLLTVEVDGSASSDPEGGALSYGWDWGDGVAGSTATPTASHVYATAGNYTVTLTVTDPQGATDTETAGVQVNRPPVPSFTTGTANLQASVDSAASSDPDGQSFVRAWDWGDGQSDLGGVARTHAYAGAGTYTITLTLTDAFGATATTTRSVTVSNGNAGPAAGLAANATSGTAPLDVQLSLSGSDSDGSIASWTLQFGDGTQTTGTSLPTTRTKQYAAGGTYTANLTVVDDLGATATASVTVSVNARPTATLSANRTAGAAPFAVDLTLGGSDVDGSVASWVLQFGDGTQATGTALSILQGKTYNASGAYQANLTVTDNDGATHTATVTLVVSPAANVPPVASLSGNVTSGTAPLDVAFSLGGSDADGSVASWTLQFGDGTTASGASLPATRAKQYARGTYLANLTVTDDDGATHTASVPVTVNGRPTASFAVTGTSGLQVDVDAGASSDADGSVVLYNWEWGDGSSSTTATATTSRFYATGGTYVINLTVTDDFGAASAPVSAIATPNRAPVLASVTQTALSDLNVTLSASATDADGDAVTYTFVWGDGSVTSGASASASRAYALPGNHTVRVYANDTRGGSATTTIAVALTQTVYASAADTSFASPGGVATGIANVAAADGLTVDLTEANTGSTVSAVTGCDSSFMTQAPLSCTLPGLTWKVNTSSTGGAAGWTMALDASQGTPTADGALSFSPNANGANTGRLNYHFNLTGAAGTTLTNLQLNWKMTANGGTGLRSLTAVLVAPNGTAVTIGTASTTTNTAWGTFTGNVADNFLTAPGTYLLRIDYLSNKNGDVLNLDNLHLNWTATNTYRLQKELSMSPVPASAGLSHHLEIAARQSANAEALQVQVFDGSAWTTRATVSSASMTTYVVKLTAAEVNGGTVRVRLVDATASSDPTASSWLVDHARVVVRGA